MLSDSIPTIESSYILQSSTNIPVMRNMLNGNEDDASSDPGPTPIQEDWGLVSQDASADHGVLILAASGEIETNSNEENTTDHPSSFPVTLSVPAIDNIPSDIGSLPDERDIQNLLGTHDESLSHGGTDILFASREDIQELKMMTKRGYTFVGLLALFFMATTSFLVYERQAWKSSNLNLEAQLRQIEEQLNKTKAKANVIPTSWIFLAAEQGFGRGHDGNAHPFEKLKQVNLGKSAARARDSVKAKAKEIGDIVFQAQEDFVNKAQSSVTQAHEVIAVKAQEVMEKVDEGAHQIRKAIKTERAKLPGDWKKIATTVASGVVTISLAALFADDVSNWMNDLSNNGATNQNRREK